MKTLQRPLARYAAVCVLVALLVVLCRAVHANSSTVGFVFLLAVLVVSAAWGLRCAILCSSLATLTYHYFFLPPFDTFTIADPRDWIALVTFLLTAVIASELSERARRETENANSRRREMEQLYAFSQELLTADDVLGLVNGIPGKVAASFGALAAALYSVHSGRAYYSGAEAQAVVSLQELRQASSQNRPIEDRSRNLRIRPLQAGSRSVGALAILGDEPSTRSMEAIGNLVAIAIERVAAVDQLAHAEAERESERLRSVLLDSVTHDFRTPLTAIKAAAQSLLGEAKLDEAAQKELLTVIDEECDRLDRLVGEAAEMSTLDARAFELDLRAHSILDPIAAAIDHNQKSLARHTVVLDVSDRLPPVKMDLKRTQEILSQLLDNAAKYSPAGTRITVTATVQGEMLVTSVADEGPGIDSADQSMIFDKFYRGRSQRYKVQGTGMGLAIAKAIVEAHGGAISLVSQPGHGAVFSFTLPLRP
jgi:two-component system sensor histidine kinase KdpD